MVYINTYSLIYFRYMSYCCLCLFGLPIFFAPHFIRSLREYIYFFFMLIIKIFFGFPLFLSCSHEISKSSFLSICISNRNSLLVWVLIWHYISLPTVYFWCCIVLALLGISVRVCSTTTKVFRSKTFSSLLLFSKGCPCLWSTFP